MKKPPQKVAYLSRNSVVSEIFHLKFIYSEKASKFCKISILLSSYVVPVKSKVEISQNFVAFSEYMNFTAQQPKWQNSCSKRWSIEQLYIELPLHPSQIKNVTWKTLAHIGTRISISSPDRKVSFLNCDCKKLFHYQ